MSEPSPARNSTAFCSSVSDCCWKGPKSKYVTSVRPSSVLNVFISPKKSAVVSIPSVVRYNLRLINMPDWQPMSL